MNVSALAYLAYLASSICWRLRIRREHGPLSQSTTIFERREYDAEPLGVYPIFTGCSAWIQHQL